MGDFGHASQRKVGWAEKHIGDLNSLLLRLQNTRHHAISVDQDAEKRNWINVEYDPSALKADEAALIIGDALHNLRSALDILWHEVIRECGGTTTKYTRFPVRDTREELIPVLGNALKKKQISDPVHDLLLDTITPYEARNYFLWALDDLNIRDKHQLIIPVLNWTWIAGVCFEDDNGTVYDAPVLVADKSFRGMLPIDPYYRKNLTVKDQGQASPNILFNHGFPFQGRPVIPALSGISKEVTRTIKAFDLLFFSRTTAPSIPSRD
jgi:hypothetical protein